LDAYKCVILQFVSDFFIPLVYTLPSVFLFFFLILHSVLKEICFVVFKMCQVIMTRSVLLLLQFGPCETDFMTFFLLHYESGKQQFWPSPILWRLAS